MDPEDLWPGGPWDLNLPSIVTTGAWLHIPLNLAV